MSTMQSSYTAIISDVEPALFPITFTITPQGAPSISIDVLENGTTELQFGGTSRFPGRGRISVLPKANGTTPVLTECVVLDSDEPVPPPPYPRYIRVIVSAIPIVG